MSSNALELNWYRENIVKLPLINCAAPWTYEIFVECNSNEIVYLFLTALLAGALLGALRLYNQISKRIEKNEYKIGQKFDQNDMKIDNFEEETSFIKL